MECRWLPFSTPLSFNGDHAQGSRRRSVSPSPTQQINFGAYKITHPDFSSVSQGMQVLRTLHWFPVKARIQCKIACLCFKCICQNSMPPYISDLHPYCPSRTLRSLDTSLLTVNRFSLETFGKRSFCFWTYCLELPTTIPLKKQHSVSQRLKRNVRPIYLKLICT